MEQSPLSPRWSLQCPPAGVSMGSRNLWGCGRQSPLWGYKWVGRSRSCKLWEENCPSRSCPTCAQGGGVRVPRLAAGPGSVTQKPPAPGSCLSQKLASSPRSGTVCSHRKQYAGHAHPLLGPVSPVCSLPVLPLSSLGLRASLSPSQSPLLQGVCSDFNPCCPTEWRSLEASTLPVDPD